MKNNFIYEIYHLELHFTFGPVIIDTYSGCGGVFVINKNKYIDRFLQELEKVFDNIKVEQNNLFITKGNLDISIPVSDMHREFITKGYEEAKGNYIEIIERVMEEKKATINLDEVRPIIKNKSFYLENKMKFIKDELAGGADVEVLFALDKGSCWKYLTIEDIKNSQISIAKVKKVAYANINKLTNGLVCMDNDIEIYRLKYETDLGASILLSFAMQEQIKSTVGKDVLIAMPSEGMLLVAKYSYSYLDIMQILIDSEVNEDARLSKKLYRYRDGKLQPVNMNRRLELVR